MARIIFVFVIVVAVISTVWSGLPPKKEDCKPECGKNEEWTDCLPACPPSCNPKKGIVCHKACVGKGCQCKHGYVRNKHNECVLPCMCDC